jgi:hypothetical protein
VTANAADNVGVVGVQFKLDGADLGAEDTTAPYSIPWDTTAAANGSHAVTATARDAAGNATTSASVTAIVDNSAPTVSLTAPAAGVTVAGAITVSAAAADNLAVAGVQFFVDGAPLGAEDVTAPFEAAWNTMAASDGSHALTATARDAVGNTTTSASVTVAVDNTAPAISVTAPASGATVSASIAVTAAATDNVSVAGVQFFLDGAPLGGEDTSVPHEIIWDTTVAADGAHSLTAVARDGAGNTAAAAAVTVTVSNAPTVTRVEDNGGAITLTPAGAWLEGYTGGFGWSGGTAALGFSAGQRATLSFSGTEVRWIGFRGPQTGIATVHLDGALVATIDPYHATDVVQSVLYTATGLANGPHTLAIEVTRTKNELSSDYFVVVDAFDVTSPGGGPPADTTPPTVSITTPSGGTTVSATVTVTAGASDNVSVAGVTFFVDGVQLGAEDTAAPYQAGWNTMTAANGAHTLTAVARDGGGNTTSSAAVTVTVSNAITPPASVATRFEDTDLAIT